jgi:hypothetical protein
MRAAISKAEIESAINSRFGPTFQLHEKRPAEAISTGISQVDAFTLGGLPRGAITELFGPASSGRTSFMLSALAHATTHDEVCAVVDTNNGFDPASAAKAAINFERLLWIQCASNLEHAFKATDLLLQAGGFGLVTLDLGDVPAKSAKRIISSWWYRFRRALETTPTALVVIAEESCVRSCATLAFEMKTEACLWSSSTDGLKAANSKVFPLSTVDNNKALRAVSIGSRASSRNPIVPSHSKLLQGVNFHLECRRPLYLNSENMGVVSLSH